MAAALLSATVGCVDRTGGPPPRPNILLIQADDLGYGDIGVYGQSSFRTPSLDRLAREGIRFTKYYAGSPECAASRATLMTGLHTGHSTIRGNAQPDFAMPAEEVTVAMALQDAGYRTAMIGKWGLGGPGTTGEPNRKGFEYSFGFLEHRHAHRKYTDHLYRDGERVPNDPDRYADDLFTEEAMAYVAESDDRPFFVYLNYTAPHADLHVPEDSLARHLGRFDETPYIDPDADARIAAGSDPESGYASQPNPRAAYAAMIERLDRDVGLLVESIDGLGMGEQTLIIFVSDNGPQRDSGIDPSHFESNGGLRGIKNTLYEGGLRVPMIARWAGTIPAGRTSDHVWTHWDVLPTLAELAGAEGPDGIDGMSMVGALRGEKAPVHEFLYWENHRRDSSGQAVRAGKWKLLRSIGTVELYDLEADPAERDNVAEDHPDVVARIQRYLEEARTPSVLWPDPPRFVPALPPPPGAPVG